MAMSKFCGPHTDLSVGGTVTRRTVDLVDTLRFYASKPDSPDFYALAADELVRLRKENKELRYRLHTGTTPLMSPTPASEASP